MYGLVCLSSLLALWSGERYCEEKERRYLIPFIGACFLGFLSDYSFILLFPYIITVLFSRKMHFKKMLGITFILLITIWLMAWGSRVNFQVSSYSVYFWHLFNDMPIIARELGAVLFNFWFEETLLVAFLLLLVALWIDLKSNDTGKYRNKHDRGILYSILVGFITLIILDIFILNETLRMRVAAPIVLVVLIFLIFKCKEINILDLNINRNRMVLAIICAAFIVICVSPIFWRDLRSRRFLMILTPFVLFFISLTFERKVIESISILLFIAGLMYIFSYRISRYYPPPAYNSEAPVIYQDVFCYSSQYIKFWRKKPDEPFIFDQSGFKKRCKICRIGKNTFDFSKYEQIRVIARYNYNPRRFIPSDFILVSKTEYLTWLDRFEFKYMTPFYPARQATFLYSRVEASQSGF